MAELTEQGQLTRRGRRPFQRNHRSLDLPALADLASAALDDDVILLTPERISFACQIDRRTAVSLIESGLLPSVQIPVQLGNRIITESRVPAEALLTWITNNTSASVATVQSR